MKAAVLCRSARLLAAAWLTLAARPAVAEDTVRVQPRNSVGSMTYRGEIEDYSGAGLVLISETGTPRREFSVDEVISVATPQHAEHLAGAKQLEAGQPLDALARLQIALAAEPRAWVRREILALMVRANLRLGDYAQAGENFLVILKSDRNTIHFRLIPLGWSSLPPRAERTRAAQLWIRLPDDVARLMGTSFLLNEPEHQEHARRVLRELMRSSDARVQALAQAQSWRLRLEAGDVSEAEVARWQERLASLPPGCRGGPSYLVGQGWAVLQNPERAALAWLWLPLMAPDDHFLAARASLQAADAMQAQRDGVSAAVLYHETALRFGDTPYGREAAARLKPAGDGDSSAASEPPPGARAAGRAAESGK